MVMNEHFAMESMWLLRLMLLLHYYDTGQHTLITVTKFPANRCAHLYSSDYQYLAKVNFHSFILFFFPSSPYLLYIRKYTLII